MLLSVSEIRHDGLVLVAADAANSKFWLPASEFDEMTPSWEEFRDTSEPDLPVHVKPINGKFGPDNDGFQVVTTREISTADLCDIWKGEVHGLKIERLSKTLILGRIGPIQAVMDRRKYTECLDKFPRTDLIRDHSALAVGDFVCGVFKSEHGDLGRVEVSWKDALDVLKKHAVEQVDSHSADFTPLKNREPLCFQGFK